ncbi:MAG: hypothetical protein WC138_04100, partial [Methanoculleus sp.]
MTAVFSRVTATAVNARQINGRLSVYSYWKEFDPITAEDEAGAIHQMARRMAAAVTKGDLGLLLAEEVSRYSLMDLQIIGGRLHA